MAGDRARSRSKREQRRTRALRASARVVAPLDAAQERRDPLHRARRSAPLATLLVIGAVAASIAVHGAVIALAYGAGMAFSSKRSKTEERIQVAIREVPPPPLPPVTPIEPPKPEPPPKEESKPTPKVRPKEKSPERPPPPPDPINRAPEKTPPKEPPKTPYRVVGLNLESTVSGGEGPAFAVGNTRMGETSRVAEDAARVETLPKTNEPPPTAKTTNRVATRIPTVATEIKKPRRTKPVLPEYPEEYRTQAIEGNVVVTVVISPSGRVTRVDIAKGSGFPKFDEAAKAAALREVFAPAEENGRPIEYTITFTYRFRLNE